MTRYAMNKALWTYAHDADFRGGVNGAPQATLAPFELSDAERAAIGAKDIRRLFALGAHPFLVYSFAIEAIGPWSFPFMERYCDLLKGLELGDIET